MTALQALGRGINADSEFVRHESQVFMSLGSSFLAIQEEATMDILNESLEMLTVVNVAESERGLSESLKPCINVA